MTPGVWIQAQTLTDIVWALRLQRGEGFAPGRTLDAEHFEFRNEGAALEGPAPRRRASDRLRPHGD